MLKIRLTRTGRKKRPSYRVVVAEARWARDGRRIAELGYYDPLTDPSTIRLDVAATEDWI
ncbi:30S ribosomal protein S16, partial [Methylobacterium crusticola]|uniref:30S ribosomal protein S16 n=1 Tax=Methylobacterium crusticola TaxID=1697972 RepID=UPI001EE31BF9